MSKLRVTTLAGNDGDIRIGVTINRPQREVRLRHSDFLRHCIIVGTTGSGKSTTAGVIASQLSKFGIVIILDWYGEFPQILDKISHKYTYYRASEHSKIPVPSRIESIINILEEVLDLTPPQSYILRRVLKGGLTSFKEVLHAVDEFEVTARWMIESKYALLRKLGTLFSDQYVNYLGSTYECGLVDMLKRSSRKPMVVDLSVFEEYGARKFMALLVLRLLEEFKSQHLITDKVFVIVDESHNILTSSKSLLERMMAEVRKLNMGITLITQSPALLSYRIISNSNIKIIHALKSRDDVDVIARSVGSGVAVDKVLPRLGVGEVVVDAPSLASPVLVKVNYA